MKLTLKQSSIPNTDSVSPSEAPENVNKTEPTGSIGTTEPPPEDVNTTESPSEDVNTTEPADRLNPSRPMANITSNGTRNEVENAGQGSRSGNCSDPSENVEETKNSSRGKSGRRSRSRFKPKSRSKMTKNVGSRCQPAAAGNVTSMNRTSSPDVTANLDSNPHGKEINSVPSGRQNAVEVGGSNEEQINMVSNESETSKSKSHKQKKGGKKLKSKKHKSSKKRKSNKRGRKRRHTRSGENYEIEYMYINN